MASKSVVFKTELVISDMDRHYYATHNLVLAQHPSEPDRRLIARLVVFVLFAHERLEFGRGISSDEDPDLWRKDLTGVIEQWIELGQPDESEIRKACGRSQHVVIVTYSGNSAGVWWSKIATSFSRLRNLTVIDLDSNALDQATLFLERSMKLSATIQEGELFLSNGTETLPIPKIARM